MQQRGMAFVRVTVRIHGQLADGRIGGHSEGTCLQPHSLQAMIALVMFSTKSELSAWETETALISSSLASALCHWNLELRRLLNRVDVLDHELQFSPLRGHSEHDELWHPHVPHLSDDLGAALPSVFASRALACSWLCSFARANPCCWVCSFVSFARVDPCSWACSFLSFACHIVVPVLRLLRLSVSGVASRSRSTTFAALVVA